MLTRKEERKSKNESFLFSLVSYTKWGKNLLVSHTNRVGLEPGTALPPPQKNVMGGGGI